MKSALVLALCVSAMGMNLRDSSLLQTEEDDYNTPQLVLYSSADTSVENLADNSTSNAQAISISDPDWQGIPGAQDIWVSSAGEDGTFLFIQNFEVPSTVTSASLWVSAGDQFVPIISNSNFDFVSQAITQQNYFFDLTPYIAEGTNTLQLLVYNYIGEPGLAYKIELS